ncbi:hypothetical protein JYQ79_16315, partial [Anaerobutyricum hallii]|uniref:hypothetical protein n=1 Tax=Anaerobutyricum hallii TaxID=39488 RepID=UPI00305ED9FC|nr:hypothetical protein [Anaerobutyricum hallii]
ILDLCDRRPVAYVIGDSNNNALVLKPLKKEVKQNQEAIPIFNRERGYKNPPENFNRNWKKQEWERVW